MLDLKFDGESFATSKAAIAVFDIGYPIIGLTPNDYTEFFNLIMSQPDASIVETNYGTALF